MIVLGVDTSSPATSLAVVCGKELLAKYHEEHEHPPSDAVFGLLDDLLKKNGFSINDIEVFAACKGPGSFTGLRIGLGMVKTFAMALNRAVVGIDAVTCMASRALATRPEQQQDFAVVVQGFKESSFLGRFSVHQGAPKLIGKLDIANGRDEIVDWHKDGEDLFCDPQLKWDIYGATPINYEEAMAETVARLASRMADADELPDFDRVQPLYLRPFSVGKKAKRPEDMR